jgi:hypothetical protein
MSDLKKLFEQTIQKYVDSNARLTQIKLLPGGNQGFSGGTLQYYEVSYEDKNGQTAILRLVTKEAPLLERKVLNLFNSQNQQSIAYSHTLDLVTDKPLRRPTGAGQPVSISVTLDLEVDTSMLICQQHLKGEVSSNSPPIMRKAARELAALHYANLGQRENLNWLPLADRNYYERQIIEDGWRAYWQDYLKIGEFTRRFGHLTPALEATANRFIEFTDVLWQEGTSLTLVHADMQDAHVLVDQDQPYFIDWGQARYGSFYIDLPNYFTPETVLAYRENLVQLGYEIPKGEFLERYQEAGRYAGFKYLSFCLWTWREFEPKFDDSRLKLINVALNGGYGFA